MTDLFLTVAEMSLKGSYVILILLLARLLLRRAPKKYSYALWSAAAFRLVCPVSLSLPVSVFSVRTVTNGVGNNTPVDVVEDILQPALTETVTAALPTPVPSNSADPIQILTGVFAILWWVGMVALVLYAVVALVRLRRKLSTAVRLRDNIWQSDRISSPFILGLFRPKIYIPFGLEGEALDVVLAHEGYHIKRLDHVVKPLAWVLVTVHWFNPLVWIAFRCMSRDMELRCDEAVLGAGTASGKSYSAALLSLAVKERFPSPSPLAFGESGVGRRVKNALIWKKPRFWVTIVSVLVCLAVVIGCVADPWNSRAGKVVGEYDVSRLAYSEVWLSKDAYAIGANCYGMPVFEDRDAAWDALEHDYERALDYIARSFDLQPLNRANWKQYKLYGWQVTTEDESLRGECACVSAFFDIYENSFTRSGTAASTPTASTVTYTYTGKGGPFLAQYVALSYVPMDGSYYAQVTLTNGELTVISIDDELLYQGMYDSSERWTRERLKEKLSGYMLGGYEVGFLDSPEAWDAFVPEYDGLNMEALTFLSPENGEVAWMVYLFNGEPTWLVVGDENGRYFELERVN